MSRNKRQQYNRFRRKHLETETYRITHATEETLEADLDCLMGFWADTWGEKKGGRPPGSWRNTAGC
ncbi:hypothetical protein ACFQFQ_15680 [Sulfitobacter porphyrae]|uniref:Uncharacterized protein n=1 Tax=Sulfitobacter porphyrae TaxID=1246864 RepID=A0ABW2B4Y6_9RHOB